MASQTPRTHSSAVTGTKGDLPSPLGNEYPKNGHMQPGGRGNASLFSVTSYSPQSTPRGVCGGLASAAASRPNTSSSRAPNFEWDRYSQWVETPLRRPTPPSAAGGYRNVMGNRHSGNGVGRRAVQSRPPSSARQKGMNNSFGADNAASSAGNAATLRAAAALSKTHGRPGSESHAANNSSGSSLDRPHAPTGTEGQQTQDHAELWDRTVLPAVTWLYGWIEWHVQSAHVPSMVEFEHREAFAMATEAVTSAINSQPDRLAACIWRAMIALLMHFVSHMEPVQRNLAELKQQHADASAEIEALRMQVAQMTATAGVQREGSGHNLASAPLRVLPDADRPEGSRMRMRRQSTKPIHFESSMRDTSAAGGRRVGLNGVTEVIETTVDGARADTTAGPSGAQRGRRGSYFPGQNNLAAMAGLAPQGADVDALEEEIEELKDKLVEVQREAIVERKANSHLQSSLKAARAKIEKLRGGQDSDDDDDESDYDSEQDDECSDDDDETRAAKAARRRARQAKRERREAAEARKRALAQSHNRRSSLQEIEGGMLERVEKDLNTEKQRRMFLERLRAELMASLGSDYIAKIEEQMRSGSIEPDSPRATVAFKATCIDAATQFLEADSQLAQQLHGEAEGGDSEDESGGGSIESSPKMRKKRSPKGGKGIVIKMLNMRQIAWTIQTIFEEKTKRDAIDELEHRPKLKLQAFVPDFFVNRHGLRDLGDKYHANFRAGTMAAANGGNRKALIFSWLCGYMAFEGDKIGALTQATAQTFLLELERKAIVAAGETKGHLDSELVWVPLDRAIELMRKEFSYAKVMDVSKCTIEIEQLLRLPDEIHEINKAKDAQSNFVPQGEIGDSPTARRASLALAAVEVPTVRSLPPGFDVLLFREKPHEEQSKLLRRREDALVQNKVLRAVARRGISLRELFSMLDDDDSGEIDPQEFIKGIQGLEGQLTDAQCERLMEITDTDHSGTIDFNELTHALQKRDLRVEMSEFLIICLRFFSAEMQRTAQALRKHFSLAAAKGSKPMPIQEDVPEGSPFQMGEDGGEDSTNQLKMNVEGVKLLLKNLDAPFQAPVVQKLLGEMVRYNPEGGGTRLHTQVSFRYGCRR